MKVKHTKNFSNKYFNEHPHKYNLFGLSKMLSDYGVENAATKIEDKENNIQNIETPFIAYTGSDFIPVYKITHDSVSYISKNGNVSIPTKDFCEFWTGITLFAEPNSTSAEPNYKENRRKELFGFIQKIFLLSSIFIIFLLAYISKSFYSNLGLTIGLFVNFSGIYIGYLLVQKQMHIHSEYADKICSLFKQSDCNDVLESKAAKLFGLIGWSEIGLGYFISNTLILLFLSQFISYLALINICALPYSLWSIWYQKNKAKQWCPLCLIVQGLLWAIFIVNLTFGFIQMPILNTTNILIVACLYLIPLLAINMLIPQLSGEEKMEQIIQEINSIKANEDIFLTLLNKQPYYDVYKSTSNIILGNPDGNILITVFTNPHCNPCAEMHSRIEKTLKQTDKLCIQYIFSSFDKSLDLSNKFLMAVYLNNSQEKARKIYSEWFSKGKFAKESFFQMYEMNIVDEKVEMEFQKHEAWKKQTGLRATPTILVNGYRLPDNYKIEDIRFFSEL
ncbi:MAG: thioredoxin domain-containing protein [Prevotella sp.]|nr:thioredoxin domain-containing protein [Prevotella sp.]